MVWAGNHISISLANRPASLVRRTSVAMASVSPETATEDVEFTTESSAQPGVSAIARSAWAGSIPSTATRYGPVSPSSRVARAATTPTASCSVMAPAMWAAPISPRLCPTVISGVTPQDCHTRARATPCTNCAPWIWSWEKSLVCAPGSASR